MDSVEVLTDGFDRVRQSVHDAVRGLKVSQINERIGQSNSIAWLLWHLARVQDDHVSEVAEREQTWTADGWYRRFGLDLPQDDTGFGHTNEEVDLVQVRSVRLLTGYYDAVHERTLAYLDDISAEDLDVVIDESWSPPVTLGVRLVSVIADDLQHAGQAAFVRGLLLHR
ncbi:DUF664 domain-containing protein [Saccharomonospora sp. NB11]|jgi:uncharacterized damage-inducible protein DinB|uniref:mycothiol transferase n=1 Tax=Saccharomonospora sp. NB11 TaxID=1642298 RepID=UPI0018D1635E|nr:DUF664 domain-containing protein [Saccharomonospora sp. NB11]